MLDKWKRKYRPIANSDIEAEKYNNYKNTIYFVIPIVPYQVSLTLADVSVYSYCMYTCKFSQDIWDLQLMQILNS